MYCCVVKSPVFRLQRGSAKSPLAPSSQDLLDVAYKSDAITRYDISIILEKLDKLERTNDIWFDAIRYAYILYLNSHYCPTGRKAYSSMYM